MTWSGVGQKKRECSEVLQSRVMEHQCQVPPAELSNKWFTSPTFSPSEDEPFGAHYQPSNCFGLLGTSPLPPLLFNNKNPEGKGRLMKPLHLHHECNQMALYNI